MTTNKKGVRKVTSTKTWIWIGVGVAFVIVANIHHARRDTTKDKPDAAKAITNKIRSNIYDGLREWGMYPTDRRYPGE